CARRASWSASASCCRRRSGSWLRRSLGESLLSFPCVLSLRLGFHLRVLRPCCLCRCHLRGIDADFLPPAFRVRFEAHETLAQRVERVVAADADVPSGVHPRAPLAKDDRARQDDLSIGALDAEALRVAVAAVA